MLSSMFHNNNTNSTNSKAASDRSDSLSKLSSGSSSSSVTSDTLLQFDSSSNSSFGDDQKAMSTGVSSIPRKLADMLTPLLRGSSTPPASPTAVRKQQAPPSSPAAPSTPPTVARQGIQAPMTPTTPPTSRHAASPATLSDSPPPAALTPMTVFPALGTLLEAARNCALPPSRTDIEPGTPNYPTSMLALSPVAPPRMQRAGWCLADYTVVEKLYKGYASTVFKAVCKSSGDVVVLKVYTLAAVCDLYKYQIYREVHLHSSVQHENIITMHAAFQEGDKVVMVQEYADGADLFNVLHKYGGRLSERLAVQLVLDPFMRVLHYLHSKGIIHRDIKPENILFTKNMVLKLGDFGLAIDLKRERAVTRAGTLDYMAPEVLRCPFKSRPDENKDNEQLHYSGRVDSWAVGVMTYELLAGCPPFYDKSRTGTETQIHTTMPKVPPGMTEDAWNFIASSLCKVAANRPTIHDMLHHSWIEGYRSRRSLRHTPGSMTPASPTSPQQQITAAATPAVSSVPQSMSRQLNKCESQAQVNNAATVMQAMQQKASKQHQVDQANMDPSTPQKAPPASSFNRGPIMGSPSSAATAAAMAVRSRLGMIKAPAAAPPSRDELARNLKDFQVEISRKMASVTPSPAAQIPSAQHSAETDLSRDRNSGSPNSRLSAALHSTGHADGSVIMNIGSMTMANGGKGAVSHIVSAVNQIHL